MPDAAKYILDANIFIEAKRRYYGFDLCPGFWEALIYHNSKGNIASIDRVRKELLAGKDDLAVWSRKTPDLFASTDSSSVINAYKIIIRWVQNQSRFTDTAKSEFANNPDAWVIAYAKATDATVVTHEQPAARAKKIKIPDVCKAIGVQSINTFDMLKKLEVVFDWTAP